MESVTNTIKCDIYKEAVTCKTLQSREVNSFSFSWSVNIIVIIHDKEIGTEIPGENYTICILLLNEPLSCTVLIFTFLKEKDCNMFVKH